MKKIWITLIFLSLLNSAYAANYYISPSGSDSNEGSINSPWKTISHASRYLGSGDTLYVRGGIYYGQGDYDWYSGASGTSTNPITFKAYPGEEPIFDGQWSVGHFLIFTGSHSWIVVDGFTIRHYDNEWGNGAIQLMESANNIVIQNNLMIDNGKHNTQDHHIYLGATDVHDIIIRNNLLINAAAGGIHGWHGPNARNVDIYNNIIRDCVWGIILADGAQDIEIYNNVFYNNDYAFHFGLEGVDVTWGVRNVKIRNNIIDSCGQGLVIGSFNSGNIDSDYNLWYQTSGTDSSSHSLYGNPIFSNPSNNDFHINSGSPAIDSGIALSGFNFDYEGVPRPQGSGWDIGAYEYGGVAGTTTSTSTTLLPIQEDSWEAEDGIIEPPFIIENGYIYQSIYTDENPYSGGKASYIFNIDSTGDYKINTIVNAKDLSSNSFFINIDEEPTTYMIWDIPITDGFEERTVSWRGSGTYEDNEFDPKIFTLSSGEHELIIWGREAYTLLDNISLELVSEESTPTTGSDNPPDFFNLRHNPVTVLVGHAVDILVDWFDDVGLQQIIIQENSTGEWRSHTVYEV